MERDRARERVIWKRDREGGKGRDVSGMGMGEGRGIGGGEGRDVEGMGRRERGRDTIPLHPEDRKGGLPFLLIGKGIGRDTIPLHPMALAWALARPGLDFAWAWSGHGMAIALGCI